MSHRVALPEQVRYHAKWVLPITAPAIENGTVIVEGSRADVVADPKTREVYLGN